MPANSTRWFRKTLRGTLAALAFAATATLVSAQDPDDEKPPEKPAAKKPGAKKPGQPAQGRPGGRPGQAGGVHPGQQGPGQPALPGMPGVQGGGGAGGIQVGGGGGAGPNAPVPNTGVNGPRTDGIFVPGFSKPDAGIPGANKPNKPDGYDDEPDQPRTSRPPGTGGPISAPAEGIRVPGASGGAPNIGDGGFKPNRPDGYDDPASSKSGGQTGPSAAAGSGIRAPGTPTYPGGANPDDASPDGKSRSSAAGVQRIDPGSGGAPSEGATEDAEPSKPLFESPSERANPKATSPNKDRSGFGNGGLIFAVAIIVGLVLVGGMVLLIVALNKRQDHAYDLYNYGYDEKPPRRQRRRSRDEEYGRT